MTPLLHAEQATLGAVLLEPHQLGRLAPWLQPAHFYRPIHQALYAAALKLRDDGHPAASLGAEEPVPLSWLADTVVEAGAQTRGVTASYAHQVVSSCPRPGHAVVYGRMVLEGAIRRSVAQHATQLHQAARADAPRGTSEESVRQAEALSTALRDLGGRWGTDVQPVPHPLPPSSVPAELDAQLLAEEEYLLGSLSARPEQLDQVMSWLHSGDFADAGHQQVYRALAALHHRGEPVDQLTVLWEIQRRGALADRTLDTDRVLRICDSSSLGGAAEHYGERVVRAALVRTAADTARRVRALANDESLAPGKLIGHALHALGPLSAVHDRLRTATGDVPASPPAPARAAPAREARADAARIRSSARRPGSPPASTPTSAPHPVSFRPAPRRSPS
ncbi:DnaB-like helicase N-terminal domain-containing protein [Streptomyces sp. NPDC056367]|uniref:DnaB-like helicase N-terminal domain-containing protein n=1 Tax=Streptomyces sp. NPDC056367 TaxID=3345797 RepID=UPI0035DB881C